MCNEGSTEQRDYFTPARAISHIMTIRRMLVMRYRLHGAKLTYLSCQDKMTRSLTSTVLGVLRGA